jgi:hypothetical protein
LQEVQLQRQLLLLSELKQAGCQCQQCLDRCCSAAAANAALPGLLHCLSTPLAALQQQQVLQEMLLLPKVVQQRLQPLRCLLQAAQNQCLQELRAVLLPLQDCCSLLARQQALLHLLLLQLLVAAAALRQACWQPPLLLVPAGCAC